MSNDDLSSAEYSRRRSDRRLSASADCRDTVNGKTFPQKHGPVSWRCGSSFYCGSVPEVGLGDTTACSWGVGSSPNGTTDARRVISAPPCGNRLSAFSSFLNNLLFSFFFFSSLLCRRQLIESHAVAKHLVDAPHQQPGYDEPPDLLATLAHDTLICTPIPRNPSGPQTCLDKVVT